MATAPVLVRCDCGGRYFRDRDGRAVCEACKGVITMESLLALGFSPVWDMNVNRLAVTKVGR